MMRKQGHGVVSDREVLEVAACAQFSQNHTFRAFFRVYSAWNGEAAHTVFTGFLVFLFLLSGPACARLLRIARVPRTDVVWFFGGHGHGLPSPLRRRNVHLVSGNLSWRTQSWVPWSGDIVHTLLAQSVSTCFLYTVSSVTSVTMQRKQRNERNQRPQPPPA